MADDSGLGRSYTVEIGGGEARCAFEPEEWVGEVWRGAEGGRYTSATEPDRYVVLRAVDLNTRVLIFSGDVTLLTPGAALYYFDPDWKPDSFITEATNG